MTDAVRAKKIGANKFGAMDPLGQRVAELEHELAEQHQVETGLLERVARLEESDHRFRQLLEKIASGAGLEEVLTSLTKFAESQVEGILCSILLLDETGRRLRHGAAPSLPDDYVAAIDGVEIGPNVGSCGMAVYRDEPVIVSDIATDPLWANYRDLALDHGLCACWSLPIRCSTRRVLGTFAVYNREPRIPDQRHRQFMERLVNLASIVIEHARDKQSLQRSEERLSQVLDATTNGVWDWNMVTDEVVRSPQWYRSHGYESGDLEPHVSSWEQLVHPEDMPRVQEKFNAYLEGKTDIYECEYRLRTKSGVWQWNRDRGKVVARDNHGIPLRMVGTDSDISELKQAEQALREVEDRFNLAVQGSHDGHWHWNIGQRQGWWSPRLLEMLGYSEGEINTTYMMFIRLIHPDDRKTVSEAIRNHLIDHDDYDVDLRMRTKSGEYRSFHARGSGVWNEQGWPIRMAGSLRDNTDRIRIELEAHQHREQLLHVTRLSAMGEMATGLAHEVNQPLAAIANYVYAIEQQLQSPRLTNLDSLRDTLAKIKQQSLRAGDIIRRMRDFVRRKDPHRSTCDVNALVREIADLVMDDARHHSVQVDLNLDASLPNSKIDAVQIQQVLLNILRNAIDELKLTNGRRRSIVVTTGLSDDEQIEIAVRDSGRGFPDENIDRSFDAFFTTKPEGMGMGLAISRSIVEQHGGRMWATPNLAVGAELRFTLPLTSAGDRANVR